MSAMAMAIAAAVATLLFTVIDLTDAEVIYISPPFQEFPVVINLRAGPYDISACDAAYNPETPDVVYSVLTVERESQFALLHMEDYEDGRAMLCNQCLKIQNIDNSKSVIVRLVGDCKGCVENEIQLSPAAYDIMVDGSGAVEGFFTPIMCPDSSDSFKLFGPLKGLGSIPWPAA
ncbi:hypothetical protein BGZ97_007998 [Linnemannia gamsii]|uniref:Expansin-like EG45 domain-containing protein n=1 Tax=Linnemannia gamsii TaxID=64522 RepID=A0A9P6UR56_9FUNG|nr:hypothetical protein BGZ97_007998 [Linnemannia gamsii]